MTEPKFGTCDFCDRNDVQLRYAWVYGTDAFVCWRCRQAEGDESTDEQITFEDRHTPMTNFKNRR